MNYSIFMSKGAYPNNQQSSWAANHWPKEQAVRQPKFVLFWK